MGENIIENEPSLPHIHVYIEKESDIIHETSVDFVLRHVSREVNLVQYDNLLPIIKIKLYNNGERYILPDEARVNLRFGKVDRTFVYKSVLGCNASRDAVYVQVDEQMTAISSKAYPVLELIIGSDHACSSSIAFIIDRNPVQNDDIESTDEFPLIYDIQEQVDKLEEKVDDIIETGGEPNVLESISVNDVPVPIDENKNSNLETLDEAEALSILVYGNN